MKKLGRPIKGKQARVNASVRIEPKDITFIKNNFGSLQIFFDRYLTEAKCDDYFKRVLKK